MIRKKRDFQKRFLLFVEGETEERYFQGIKKDMVGWSLILKTENLRGGGYLKVLNKIHNSLAVGVVAIGVVLDLDLAVNNIVERDNLKMVLKECRRMCKTGTPIFVFASYENFEQFICSHHEGFRNGNISTFLENEFGYTDANKVKSDTLVYKKCTNNLCNLDNAIQSCVAANNFIKNEYRFNKTEMQFKNNLIINEDNLARRHSNCAEMLQLFYE